MTTATEVRNAEWGVGPEYRFDIPPFPNGWFQVAFSDELSTGDVLPLQYFGRHLVLFRGEDGGARALDAFCPHLGAHLGYGGKVEDNCIRCPFHAWRWNGSGFQPREANQPCSRASGVTAPAPSASPTGRPRPRACRGASAGCAGTAPRRPICGGC